MLLLKPCLVRYSDNAMTKIHDSLSWKKLKMENENGRIATIDDVSIFPLSWAENLILEHLGCAICAEKHLSELKICKLGAADNFT